MATPFVPPSLKSTIDESDIEYHEPIGRGGSGEVYRVTFRGTEAAAKKILLIRDKSIEEQLGKEIWFLQELRHPNIIKYYGHTITSTHVVIVTEYAAKGSLYDYLKTQTKLPGKLPEDLKRKWRIQAARGIRYLQENDILHRDIKSPNIFITADNDLKIGDFGIAKVLICTTGTNTERGTIKWQAPEVFKDFTLSLKADIFALGIVLWELETCEEPYIQYNRREQVMWAVGNDDIRPDIPSTCPTGLRILIKQCWDKDRTKRPNIDSVVARLIDIQEDDGEEHIKKNGRHSECAGSKQDPNSHGEPTQQSSKTNMQWYLKHELLIENPQMQGCCWLNKTQLGMLVGNTLDVYELSADDMRLCYKICDETIVSVRMQGVAVSDSIPDSLLAIYSDQPHIFQYPCQESTKAAKKHKIRYEFDDHARFGQIVTNSNTAVIRWEVGQKKLLVCKLPDFEDQQFLKVPNFNVISKIGISSEYLLVQGRRSIVIKSLSRLGTDLMWIDPPPAIEPTPGPAEPSAGPVVFSGKQLYTVYPSYVKDDKRKGGYRKQHCVVKYIWDIGVEPYYSEEPRRICLPETELGLGSYSFKFATMADDRLLAVSENAYYNGSLRVYQLE